MAIFGVHFVLCYLSLDHTRCNLENQVNMLIKRLINKLPRWLEQRLRAIIILCKYDISHRRKGQKPGAKDLRQQTQKTFQATPNFYYFSAASRPAWLPIYPRPELEPGEHLTKDWPVEGVDWLEVVGQERGNGT